MTIVFVAIILDLVKETVSSPELVLELLGLIKRFHTSQEICRGALVPLGFLVTDRTSLVINRQFLMGMPNIVVIHIMILAAMTATFVDGNGVALTMSTMKHFNKDTELVWHAIGILNGLNAKSELPIFHIPANTVG